MTAPRVVVAAVVVLMSAAGVHAQVIEPPDRPFRGLFGGGRPAAPGRTTTQIVFTSNILAGYGGVVDSEVGGAADPLTQTANTWSGILNAALQLSHGRAARAIAADLRGYMSTYGNIRGQHPGGEAQVRAHSAFGDGNQVAASAQVAYMPFFGLASFRLIEADIDRGLTPENDPTTGLSGTHSVSSQASVTFGKRWNTRNGTDVGASYARREYDTDQAFDNQIASGWVSYTRGLSRNLEAVTAARFSEERVFGRVGVLSPVEQVGVDGGFRYTRAVSRTRTLTFSGGGGVLRMRNQNALTLEREISINPSGYAAAGIDIGRTWAVRADYRRSAATLQGLTRDPYITDVAMLHVGGVVGRAIDLAFSVGTSSGSGLNQFGGEYQSRTGSAQLRYAVARWCSAVVGYNYYDHRLEGISNLPVGLPPTFDRHALRVGFAFWLPLYGSGSRTDSR